MASQSDPARQQMAEYYRASIKQGRAVSLKWLADNSMDVVGTVISYDTVKFWAKSGGWTRFLADDLGSSPGLRDKKGFLDKAKDDLMDPNETWADSSKGKAASAQSFLAVAKAIPDAYSLLIEQDIVEVHEYIVNALKWHWDDIISTHKKTLISVMVQLEKLLPGDVEVEEGGVSPDAALLGDRER